MGDNNNEAATSTYNERSDVVTDASEVLPAFCQSLEAILRQGLKRGLGAIGLADRDYWNCIEGLTTSSKVVTHIPPSVSHVIFVVQQTKKAQTSLCRGRLFIRIALTKGILVQALQALLDNQEYVRYWYKDYSVLVDYREKRVVLDILKTLKRKTYKLNVNNCTFLDETWLIPECQFFEFVPSAFLGLTLLSVDGKCMIIDVKHDSAAEEKGIQPGDCLDELYGQVIDEKWSVKIGQLRKKHQRKPIAVSIVKGRFEDGRWFSPLFKRFNELCAAGKCSMIIPPIKNGDQAIKDHDQEIAKHAFHVVYLGASDVGKNGSCTYVQDGIKKLFESDKLQKKRLKLQLMERDILLTCSETGEIFCRYSYTETASCAVRDDDPCQFGFIIGNTTCSFADQFKCHLFACESSFMARQIIEGIGKGFDRTIYCV